MSVYIVSEPEFRKSTWCQGITEGLIEGARKKKTEVVLCNGSSPEEYKGAGRHDMIAVVAHNPGWLRHFVRKARSTVKAHITVIGAQSTENEVSSVTADTAHSVRSAMLYLSVDCKKTSTALYGVNPNLSADLCKLSAFGEDGKVYYNRNNLAECFHTFASDIDSFDSVICTNDYVALSLINQLKASGLYAKHKPFIVSLANTGLAPRATPSITSVTNDEQLLGETAVSVCFASIDNPNIEAMKVNVRCRIIPRDTTDRIAVSDKELYPPAPTSYSPTLFYSDEEVTSLLKIEKLLSSGDMTDVTIISMLATGSSYEEIAESVSMSVGGIKYRVASYTERCGFSGNKELKKLLARFFYMEEKP